MNLQEALTSTVANAVRSGAIRDLPVSMRRQARAFLRQQTLSNPRLRSTAQSTDRGNPAGILNRGGLTRIYAVARRDQSGRIVAL